MKRLLSAAAVTVALSGCMGVRYIPQAASGQLKLMTSTRKIDRVIADPEIPPRVARLLAEVDPVRRFAQRNGLDPDHSYRSFVALDRPYVVWFVTGSKPLAFEPKVYWFPIAGSFAGVGWFDRGRAARHAERLEEAGYDASFRGARAYSTGGWFRDPVVSPMLEYGPGAPGALANVILHESVHATTLVKGQTYFNESLASFVADTLTPRYLADRFGPRSVELAAYQQHEAWTEPRRARVLETYERLEALYASDLSDERKLERKRAILAELQSALGWQNAPNNASLLGAKLYGTGYDEFAMLLDACNQDFERFMAATGSLESDHFARPQQEDFSPVVVNLVRWSCTPLPR